MRSSPFAITIVLFAALAASPAAAEPDPPDHALQVAAGFGVTGAMRQNGSDVDGNGHGGYAAVEYVYQHIQWATPRLYSGVLLTASQSDCGAGVTPCDVSARIFFVGGKLRLMAPIPYVGPFIETGLGVSVGKLSTRSGSAVDVTSSGFMYHIPLALGLALGNRHQCDVALQYLFHPEQEQFGGALALGFRFPL